MEKHFAALKLLDSDGDSKLSRSFSYSELPTAHRVSVQQSYHSGQPSGLVRQYSCEQILDKIANTRELKISEVVRTDNNERRQVWQTIVPYSEPFQTSNWQYCESKNAIEAPKLSLNKTPNEVEYMEVEVVDSAKESERPLFNSQIYTDSLIKNEHLLHSGHTNLEKIGTEVKQRNINKEENKNTYESVKKKFRPLVVNTKPPIKRKRNMCWCNCACLCMVTISVAVISVLLNPKILVCNRSELFSNASTELQTKIYGQEKPINEIISFLNQDFSYLKVLCIIGGTGVGKSYTTEILRRHFPFQSKVLVHDLATDQNLDTHLLNSLHTYQLLILENLKLKNLDFFESVLDVLSKHKEKCITVLAIINVEDVDDDLERTVFLMNSKDIIEKTFSQKYIDMIVVPYEPLNDEALNRCITEAARVSNLVLTQNQIYEVKEMLLSTGSGCKGAYAKVQVVGRQ